MRSIIFRSLTWGALLLLNHSAALAQAPAKSFEDAPAPSTAGTAKAGAGTAEAAPATEAPAPASEVSASSAEVAPVAPPADPSVLVAERRQKAMAEYGAGNFDVALSELDKLTRDCATGAGCPPTLEASLYRDIGIVQAGGLGEEDRAKASFGRALRLDPTIGIDQRFATSDVMDAYEAAREDFHDGEHGSESSSSSNEKANGLFLVEGTSKYGVVHAVRSLGTSTYTYTDSTLQFGGTITGTFSPGQGAFTVGPRFRGGTYIGPDLGYIGGALMIGALFARNTKVNRTGYVLGGMGFENLPNTGRTGLTFHASGGFVMSGVAFGGGLDINVGDPSNNAQYGGDHGNISVVFGLHVGFGKLY
jgi:hypothetical protein